MKVMKFLAVLLATLLIAPMVWAEGSKETAAPAIQGPYKITAMAPFYRAQPPAPDSGVLAKWETITNTKIEITWVPDPNYLDKLSLMVASGDMPMVTHLVGRSLTTGVYVNACRTGLFHSFTEEKLRSYPGIDISISKETFRDAAIDGKVYGLPKGGPAAANGLFYRKDWLDNLKLTPPTTIEEMYTVARAFTLNDPDKNGKDDTYGFAFIDDGENEAAWAGFDNLVVLYGGYNKWGVSDGALVPYWLTPEYMMAMKFFKRLYEEKLVNQDFALVKGNAKYNAMNQGKAGMMHNYYTNITSKFNDLAKSMNVEVADIRKIIDFVPNLKGKNGFAQNGGNTVGNLIAISSKVAVGDAGLNKILAYFDATGRADGELRKFYETGLQGRHFESIDANGKPVRTDAQSKLYDDEVREYEQLRMFPYVYPGWEKTKATQLEVYGITARLENSKYAVPNPGRTFLTMSKTNVEKGKELDKIISDARVKFIMGMIDEAGFNAELEKWRQQGGNAIIAELNATLKSK